jgi:hypothetical protein
MELREELEDMSIVHYDDIYQEMEKVRSKIGDVTIGAVANFVASWIEAED